MAPSGWVSNGTAALGSATLGVSKLRMVDVLFLVCILSSCLAGPMNYKALDVDENTLNEIFQRPEVQDDAMVREWIKKYTKVFFSPSFPPEKPLGPLVVQLRTSNPLYQRKPESYRMVDETEVQEHDFITGEQAEHGNDVHLEERKIILAEESVDKVSKGAQDFLLRYVVLYV